MHLGREWRHWLIGAVVVLAAAVAVAVPAIADSDWYTLSYHPLAHTPAAAPTGPLPTTLQQRWSAQGVVSDQGSSTTARTVITADAHQISGHNPANGQVRWSYRRGNTDLCSWTMDQNTVIAVYRNGKWCSDITGFNADTGKRRWYLNADLPRGISLLDGSGIYYAISPTSATGFYLDGGSKAWSFHKKGCTLNGAAAGDVGLVLLTECAGRTDVVALDGFTGKQRWDVLAPGGNSKLLSADAGVVVSSDVGNHTVLSILNSDSGQSTGVVPDTTPPGTTNTAMTKPIIAQNQWIGFDGRQVIVLDLNSGRAVWSRKSIGPPAFFESTVYVPTAAGIDSYDLAGHRTAHSSTTLPKVIDGLERVGTHAVVRSDDTIRVLG